MSCFVAILVYLLQIDLSMTFNYCETDLCPPDVKHIACNNLGYLSNNCRRSADIEVVSKNVRKLILSKHNEYRNKVAGNGIASGMRTLTWNKELAYLAELNVKQCTKEKTECIATNEFKTPGQNLALTAYSGERSLEDVVSQQIDEWILVNQTEQNKQIIIDQADRMGCAILREKLTCTTKQYLTCVYSKSNKDNDLPYTSGRRPGEKCVSGPSECYSNLCSPNE